MALDRWIALIILIICIAYGYAAFFTLDGSLPPFMRRNPVLPSTFPKVLAILAGLSSLFILLGFETNKGAVKEGEINYYRLQDYKIGQAAALIGLMIAYALLLRPAGFLLSTVGFITLSATVLGERKFHFLIPIAAIAAGIIWYLVQEVLGIFLRPWPFFMV